MNKNIKHTQRYGGQPFKASSPWIIRCCDCGLTHVLILRKNGRQLRGFDVTPYTHRSATRAARRSKRWRHVKV